MNTQLLAEISGQSAVNAVIWLIVAALVFWLITWLVAYVGVPEPFNKIIKVILAVVAVLICINALLTLVGKPLIVW